MTKRATPVACPHCGGKLDLDMRPVVDMLIEEMGIPFTKILAEIRSGVSISLPILGRLAATVGADLDDILAEYAGDE